MQQIHGRKEPTCPAHDRDDENEDVLDRLDRIERALKKLRKAGPGGFSGPGAFISGDRTGGERAAIEDAQLFLLQCGSRRGEDFFQSLAVYLADRLAMDFICIDRLQGDCLPARTLAVYRDGRFQDTIDYELKGTPCGDAVGKMVCCFPENVRELFPRDEVLQDLEAESYIGVTLWSSRGEPIGFVAAISRRPLANRGVAEAILKLVGIRAAAELERAQAEQEMMKANKAYRALSVCGQAVIHSRSVPELLEKAVGIVHDVCGYSLVWIGLAQNDPEKTVRLAAQAGDANGYLGTVRITWDDSPLGSGPTGTAIRTRQPSINRNTLTAPSLAPWRERQIQHGYLSSAAFPLAAGDEVFGALTVYAPDADAFTAEETGLFMELSSNLAHGIVSIKAQQERRRAEDELQAINARLNILADTAAGLLKTESPQQLVESLCRRIMEYLDCQAFFNFLADEERGKLHLNAWAGIPAEAAEQIEWLDYGVAVCGCAARDGTRIVSEDILNTHDIRTGLVKSYGIQAYACHPLISNGLVIGTLSFGTRTRPRFTHDELALMKTVADQVAIALERSRSESRISALNSELRGKVRELESISDEIRRSNEELDSYSSAVSHDLQEPLRSIAGLLTLLEKRYGDRLDSPGRECLSRSVASAKRLGSMIDHLLMYSRLTTRGSEFKRHDLTAILDTALENLNASISHAGAKITRAELPSVVGDAEQLVRVFQNLIGNSIKYRGKSRPEIHVSCRREAGEFVISVTDNGEGIHPDYIEHIFDIFTRCSTRHVSGTGMGLAACRKIMKRHKGRIWAESEPGKGSTFIFTLPG